MSWTQTIRTRPLTGQRKSELDQDESIKTFLHAPLVKREGTMDDRLGKLKQYLTVSDKVILETKETSHKKSHSEVQQPAIMTKTNAFLL